MPKRPNVKRLARRKDVEGLREALSFQEIVVHGDDYVDLGVVTRIDAAQALAAIDDPTAREALTAALQDESPLVREVALDGLAAHPSPAVTSALAESVVRWSDPESDGLRRRAIELLQAAVEQDGGGVALAVAQHYLDGTPGDDAAGHDAVISVLERTSEGGIRRAVVERAVERLNGAPPGPERAARLLESLPDTSLEPLIHALRDGAARPGVIPILGRIGDSRATGSLLEVLADERPETRAIAARALGEIKDPASVEGLLAACNDPHRDVRVAAVDALEGLGPAATVYGFASVLHRMLPEGSPGEPRQVAQLLAGAAAEAAGPPAVRARDRTAPDRDDFPVPPAPPSGGTPAAPATAPPAQPPIRDDDPRSETVPALTAPQADRPRRRLWWIAVPVALLGTTAAIAATTGDDGDRPAERSAVAPATTTTTTPTPTPTPTATPDRAAEAAKQRARKQRKAKQRRQAGRQRRTRAARERRARDRRRASQRRRNRRRQGVVRTTAPASPPSVATPVPTAAPPATPRRSAPAPAASRPSTQTKPRSGSSGSGSRSDESSAEASQPPPVPED